jgi:hypothetical protein
MTGALLTAGQVAEPFGIPKSWIYDQPRARRACTVTPGRYRRAAIEVRSNEPESGTSI